MANPDRLAPSVRKVLEILAKSPAHTPLDDIVAEDQAALSWVLNRRRPQWARIFGIDDVAYVELLLAGMAALENDRLRDDPVARGGLGSLSTLADEATMTHIDLANVLGLPSDPLRSRLNRWRKNHFNGWQEVTEPKARRPKYLYQVGAVRGVLREALESQTAE